MDMVALLGVVVAFTAVLFGNALEGGQFSALLDLPALIIVLGGTMGAVILQTPWLKLRRAMQIAKWVVLPPEKNATKEIDRLADWSRLARREGLLGLENILDTVPDRFQRKGLELVVDGLEPHAIRHLMENDSHNEVNTTNLNLFRILQELIRNSIQHGKSSNIIRYTQFLHRRIK